MIKRETKLVLRRFFAFLLDNLIVFLLLNIALILLACFLFVCQFSNVLLNRIGLVLVVGTVLYFSFGDSALTNNGTIGKKIFGLKVMSNRNTSCSVLRCFLRASLLVFSPLLIYYVCLEFAIKFVNMRTLVAFLPVAIAGFVFIILLIPISIIFSEDKQGLHDILSGSRVIYKKEEVENIPFKILSRKKALYQTFFFALIISLCSFLGLRVVEKTTLGSELVSFAEQYIHVFLPIQTLEASGSATNDFKNVFGGVPATFEGPGLDLEGEYFVLVVEPSKKSRDFFEEIFKFAPMEYKILGCCFSLSETRYPLDLVNIQTGEKIAVPVKTPIIYASVFLDRKGYNRSIIRPAVAIKTIERILGRVKVARRVPIIGVKIANKVNVGWFELEQNEKFYATTKGFWVDYTAATSYVEIGGWLQPGLLAKPFIAGRSAW